MEKKMFVVSFPVFSIREEQVIRESKKSVWIGDINSYIHRRTKKTEFCEYFETLKEAKQSLSIHIENLITRFDNSSKKYKKTHKKRKKELKRRLKYLDLFIP